MTGGGCFRQGGQGAFSEEGTWSDRSWAGGYQAARWVQLALRLRMVSKESPPGGALAREDPLTLFPGVEAEGQGMGQAGGNGAKTLAGRLSWDG